MDFKITDEQRDFVASIHDFCQRECGTQKKREQLTEHYSVHHNQGIYSKMTDLGWLGLTISEDCGGSGCRDRGRASLTEPRRPSRAVGAGGRWSAASTPPSRTRSPAG